MPVMDRIAKFFSNAFRSYEENPTQYAYTNAGSISSARPHTPRFRYSNERSIVSSIYTRISIDFAGADVRHVKLDEEGRYLDTMDSGLNRCFTLEANLDQGPRDFLQDIILSLFDDGAVALIPVNVIRNKETKEVKDILDLRVGFITDWRPEHVRVSVYNEIVGERQEIVVKKRDVAIIYNPLYEIMNTQNSTLQRLIRKLSLLDVVDEQSSSGKMDIIIQVPYSVKSEMRQQQANKRREDIEFQLKGSQYGIAYIDGTEKVTQLNRPAENNLLAQVEYLTKMLYGQLGITEDVMNGTATEETMLNYDNRTIEPLLDALIESMRRSFLGIKGIENNEDIRYFKNPFKYVSLAGLADIADKMSRNEILASNEVRDFLGIKPHKDPKADELNNSNMPDTNAALSNTSEMDSIVNEVLGGLSSDIDNISKGLSDG